MAMPAAVALPLTLVLPAALALAPAGLGAQGLATLPPLPAPVGLPQLQDRVSCPALQQRITAAVGAEAPVWSVSVADGGGRLLADLNGRQPRLPASNQKLISTAFALDRLGPDYHLSTKLWRLSDGSLRLTGEGDPDFGLEQLRRFAKLALGSGGGPGSASGPIRLQLVEEPAQRWWPAGWAPADRAEEYGAPITRLAVTSNAVEMAVANPPSRLKQLLSRELAAQGGRAQISLVSTQTNPDPGAVLLHEEPSLSMQGLISVANTHSHNFTAEVLLRQASGSWDLATARAAAMQWLQAQGLPMEGVGVADGSGLDRANRLTSRLLAALLLRMANHPYAAEYQASMAIAGQRGTLRKLFKGTTLDGHFYGKTGTITGVRSISGILDSGAGPRYVSMISNGASDPNQTIGQILRQVQNTSLCQANP
jgi:D-alanyl-D-alanine carboxypeptidase/D-alanyl-D-alanine-endopeptidase (penicillin-binding protein 4)